MFSEAIKKACLNARAKADMAKTSPVKYLILSVLAGFYIGLTVFFIYSVGAPLNAAGSPVTKLAMGLAFTIGLTLVVFAGSELFTGNILFVSIGLVKSEIKPREALRVLGYSYLGNLLGSLILASMVYSTGLLSGITEEYIVFSAVARVNLSITELIIRGILCNMLVCLALWMGMRVKEDITKIVLISLCLLTFVTSGYVHCIADMSQLALALLSEGGSVVGLGGYVYAIFFATLGNLIGGFVIALVYTFTGESR